MDRETQDQTSPWKEIWERKGQIGAENFELRDLLTLDGYDTAVSRISVESWLAYVGYIQESLKITALQRVCEIGCGAGAFVFPLYQQGVKIWGIDYTGSLIRICRQVMPDSTFEVAEARALPFDADMFDAVVAGSMFIYFQNFAYAEEVIREMARILKPDGRAAILDVNDAAKKERYEAIKRACLGDAEYERLYKDHKHLFYDRVWFEKVASQNNLRCEIVEQCLAGYANAEFRYNVFLEKNGGTND